MKKSRIIIPALAMIAFSMAASVTGAVAWFTAQRNVTVNAGTYAVIKTTSDLSVAVTGGVGTSDNSSGTTHAVKVNGKLTDGSFDHVGEKIYTPNESGTSVAAQPKGEIALADASESLLKRGSDGTNNIYTAVTFDLTFTITFGGSNADVALFLDNTADKTAFTTSGTATTAKGFRMAFVPLAVNDVKNGNARVLADLQTNANCKHVNSSTKATLGGNAYVSPALIDSEYTTALPESADTLANYQLRQDYLGYFKNSLKDETTNQVSIAFRVVCWYEGTDPEITNNATNFQSVTATLCFEAKDIAPAA